MILPKDISQLKCHLTKWSLSEAPCGCEKAGVKPSVNHCSLGVQEKQRVPKSCPVCGEMLPPYAHIPYSCFDRKGGPFHRGVYYLIPAVKRSQRQWNTKRKISTSLCTTLPVLSVPLAAKVSGRCQWTFCGAMYSKRTNISQTGILNPTGFPEDAELVASKTMAESG